MKPYTYIKTVRITDPNTDGNVDIELWTDNESGVSFGVDASFLDQCDNFYNPFNGQKEVTDDVMPCEEVL